MEVSVWFSWRDSVSFFAPSSSISRSVHNQFCTFSWLIWLNIKNTNLQGITLSDPCFLSAWRLFPSHHRTEIGSLHFKTWHHQCNEMKNSAQSYHLCREQWVLCCTPVHDTVLLRHACGFCSLRVKKSEQKKLMRFLKQSLTVTYQICWSKKVIHPHSEHETVPPLHHHRCYSLTIFCILFQLFVFPLSQLSYKHDKLSFLSVLLDVSASHNMGIISGPNWLSVSNKKTCEKSFKTTEKNRAYCWCQVFADFGMLGSGRELLWRLQIQFQFLFVFGTWKTAFVSVMIQNLCFANFSCKHRLTFGETEGRYTATKSRP